MFYLESNKMVNVQFVGDTSAGKRYLIDLDSKDRLEARLDDKGGEITLDKETLDTEFRDLYMGQLQNEVLQQPYDQKLFEQTNQLLTELGYQPIPQYNTRQAAKEQMPGCYDPQFQGMMKGEVWYVHLTGKKAAKNIVKRQEGFCKPAEGTAIQALAFPSKQKAKEFVETTNRSRASRLTGCRVAEQAVVFSTEIMPDAVNTVMRGNAKALFRMALPYEALNELYSCAIARR